MNVMYAATRNLYTPLKGAIKSLLDHNKVTKLYILAEDDELPYDIPCKHEVINVSNQTYFPGTCVNLNQRFTYMALMRVCAPELIRAKKLITLDVDTIVCDSLCPIWETDLTGKWIAWCNEKKGWFKPFGDKYYNFGVTVMNLDLMRKDGVTPTLVQMLNEIKLWFPEQDAMNYLAGERMSVDLDTRFNEAFCTGYTDKPAIVHFAGQPDWYENRAIFRWEYLARYNAE